MLWLGFALGSAFFAGITAVLAKVGMKNVNSTLATAIRTVVVLVFSWWMVFLVGSQRRSRAFPGARCSISSCPACRRGLLALLLPGAAAGGRQQGRAIDKSSTVLTILLAFLLLGEPSPRRRSWACWGSGPARC